MMELTVLPVVAVLGFVFLYALSHAIRIGVREGIKEARKGRVGPADE